MTPAVNSIATGTLGGTTLTLLFIIDPDDVVKTIVLALIGAVVSFSISKLLTRLSGKK